MRWERLFDDLEAQWEATRQTHVGEECKEQERWRLASLSLRDRLLSCGVRPVDLRLIGGRWCRVAIHTVGVDWLAGTRETVSQGDTASHPAAPGASIVVALGAVSAVRLGSPASPGFGAARRPPTISAVAADAAHPSPDLVDAQGSVSAGRIRLAIVLGDLCRRRTAVTVSTRERDLHGTIDRVGRDHADIALHESGTARLGRNVSSLEIVPLAQIVAVGF